METTTIGKDDPITKTSKCQTFYRKVQNFDETQHKMGKALQKSINRKKWDSSKKITFLIYKVEKGNLMTIVDDNNSKWAKLYN